MIQFVDLYAQYLTIKDEVDEKIQDVIKESAFIQSKYVKDFEQQFASHMEIQHCVSCANATDALYILMRGLKVREGDEVITTSHSWISTSETITQAGGKVVFCDTDESTFTINPEIIEEKITPRTVGIIPVHLYGQPADMDPIREIAKKHGLWIIEDCAQAHLAEYKGKKVGTFGNGAVFSFYPGKNLGAMGDAGCLTTNDSELAEWCEMFSRHGGKGIHAFEGINSRMDGLQAAILLVKLPYLKAWTQARQDIARKYTKYLAYNQNIMTPEIGANRTHVFHLYVIRARKRDELKQHLSEMGIATVLNYPRALPFYPAYSYLESSPSDYPNAHNHQSEILSLPIYPEISDDQINVVVDAIGKFYSM